MAFQLVRRICSQKKRRFVDEEYDLDLTYITDRVIAMAFPGSGVVKVWRNRIEDVSGFLRKYHEDKYLVINASDEPYDFNYFNNNVVSIDWRDHHPCPFQTYVRLVVDVLFYLQQNSGVVVVHCICGKGRTGSLVNAILYASGLFPSIEDANGHYVKMRKVAVSNASQLRYMRYFESFYDRGCAALSFKPKMVEKISLSTTDHSFWFDRFFVLKFADFSKDDLLLSETVIDGNAATERFDPARGAIAWVYKDKIQKWALPQATELIIQMKEHGLLSNKRLVRVNLSLLFVQSRSITLSVGDLDKAHGLPPDFLFKIDFYELDDFETEQHRFQAFKELDAQLQVTRDLAQDKGAMHKMLYGE